MKRIQDEDQATYRAFPHRLNERYLLMSLLGKGGFSEVYKVGEGGQESVSIILERVQERDIYIFIYIYELKNLEKKVEERSNGQRRKIKQNFQQ